MKLHRLRLRNFRGITERECVFAERGVTVVSGANEAGKSSMVEALDLLLEVPSSSKSRKVAAVQPSGHDVGTEIEAEISCGLWRFTYTKVFNKSPSTTLRVSQPKPEQLTGKLAHDRVLAILAQAVDLALLQASRVVQGTAEASVALGASASVTRALDRAVADRDGCSANGESADTDDDDLLAVVEAEYARYYTPGRGQPTGELAQAQAREGSARKALAELEAAVAAIDADVVIVEQASAQRRRLTVAADELKVRVEEAESARTKAYEIRDRFAKAQVEAEAARLRDEKWTAERDLRRATAAKIDALRSERSVATRARAQAQAARALAHEQEKQHEAARSAAEAALTQAVDALAASEAREVAARRRRELTAAQDRLQRALAAHAALAAGEAALAANTVDGEVLAQARDLRDQLRATSARVEALATSVRIVALGDLPVLVDGADIGAHGETLSIVGETVVEVPGAVRVELAPAANAADLAQQRDALVQQAARLCAAHGAADLDGAIGLGEARLAVEPQVMVARAEADRVCGDADIDELRGVVARLADQAGGADEAAGTAESEGAAASAGTESDLAARRFAERECAAALVAAERAVALHTRRTAELDAAKQRAAEDVARIDDQIADLVQALEQSRREVSDADVEARIADGVQALVSACAAEKVLRAELDEANPADAEQQVAVLDARFAALDADRAELDQRLAQARARIEVCREDARRDRRDEAAATHVAAQAELARVDARARAARLLRTVVNERRDAAHARFSEPLRRHLEDLAQPLFGTGVRFDVDGGLRVASRTLDGTTVSFDELSTGTREQIGIIARLACAMLVDEHDGVPVIIDDALGHSDPDRIAKMNRVLTRAGENAQVIVLTCSPERYRDVESAQTVAL